MRSQPTKDTHQQTRTYNQQLVLRTIFDHGKTATSDQAQEVHRFVRSQLGETFGGAFADAVRILYGGSVKPGNIAELMAMADIDGALVGGASLDADTFSQIVHFESR